MEEEVKSLQRLLQGGLSRISKLPMHQRACVESFVVLWGSAPNITVVLITTTMKRNEWGQPNVEEVSLLPTMKKMCIQVSRYTSYVCIVSVLFVYKLASKVLYQVVLYV